VHLLEKLDPKNRRWKEQQKKRALRDLARAEEMEDPENREAAKKNVAARLDDIEHSFNEEHHDLDFARKLYLIEHSIYGVDIEPIACQIAKLRFFIALLVDQKVNSDATDAILQAQFPALFAAVDVWKKIVLNPLSHAAAVPITRQEVQSAIDAVHNLRFK
jgi:hypothetical protein